MQTYRMIDVDTGATAVVRVVHDPYPGFGIGTRQWGDVTVVSVVPAEEAGYAADLAVRRG